MSNLTAKLFLKGLFLTGLAVTLAGGSAVAATTDDVKWINQCIKDNYGEEGAKKQVVLKYCTCMNNKMSDDETLSITEWEKTHPEEQKACEEESGWE